MAETTAHYIPQLASFNVPPLLLRLRPHIRRHMPPAI
jgi:hypothetical protein